MAITVPELGMGKKGSTKDLIIRVLSEEWPLSAKQLFNRIVSANGTNISYQAVHKTISSMVKEGVIAKDGKSYQLDKCWIERTQKFVKDLDSRYQTKVPSATARGRIETMFFDSFVDFVKFLVNEFYYRFPTKNKAGICLMNHAYCPIGIITEKEFDNLKQLLSESKYYAVVRGDTPLDHSLSDLFETLGKKCVVGRDFPFRDDVFISGNYVMFVFFSADFNKLMDETYSRIKSVPNKNIRLDKIFGQLMSLKTRISALIIENPHLAQNVREEAIEAFNENSKNIEQLKETEKASVEAKP